QPGPAHGRGQLLARPRPPPRAGLRQLRVLVPPGRLAPRLRAPAQGRRGTGRPVSPRGGRVPDAPGGVGPLRLRRSVRGGPRRALPRRGPWPPRPAGGVGTALRPLPPPRRGARQLTEEPP